MRQPWVAHVDMTVDDAGKEVSLTLSPAPRSLISRPSPRRGERFAAGDACYLPVFNKDGCLEALALIDYCYAFYLEAAFFHLLYLFCC